MLAPTRTLESTRARATPRDNLATVAGTTLSIAAPARPIELAARTVVCASQVGSGASGSHRFNASPAGRSTANETPCCSSLDLIRRRARDSRDRTVPRAQPSRCAVASVLRSFEVMQHHCGAKPLGEPVHLGDQRGVVRLGVGGNRPFSIAVANRALDPQLLEMATMPRLFDASPRGHAAGDPEEPAAHRLPLPDRAGLAHQDQERGLKGVVSIVRVSQYLTAYAQDHRAMAIDQGRERGLGRRRVIPCQKPVQELAIGQGPGRTQVVKRAELNAQNAARSWILHCGSPSSGSGRLSSTAMIECHAPIARFPDPEESDEVRLASSRLIFRNLDVAPVLDFTGLDRPVPVLERAFEQVVGGCRILPVN